MIKTAMLVIVTVAMGVTGSAWAQGYNGGGTVAVPNGLSGPGGTMTFSNVPAVQAGGAGSVVGRIPRGSSAKAGDPVLKRPGRRSGQRH